jgi:Erythromycin biosynthesis protein CIII-like, C-terminal domain
LANRFSSNSIYVDRDGMARILIAWEFGENWGHLSRDLPVAKRLADAGHEVICAVADTRIGTQILDGSAIRYVQAPIVRRPIRAPKALISHAEILIEGGYDQPGILRGLIGAWLGLLDVYGADAVMIDYAPTALLAGRIRGVPAVLAGTGFELPPDTAPMPTFRVWETVSPERLLRAEEMVLRHVNQILDEGGAAPLRRLAEVFQGGTRILTTFPELDHFGERPEETYAGPVFSLPGASEVQWCPEASSGRIFAYLRPWMLRLEDLLRALKGSGADVICAFPGANATLVQRFQAPRMRIFARPVALEPLLPKADLVIAYGSGTVAASLLAGVPLLLLPRWAEQYLGARRVETLGAGIVVRAKERAPSYPALIETLLSDPKYRRAARSFAAKHADFRPARSVDRVVSAIDRTLRRK